MPRKVTLEEVEAYAAEFNRRATIAREKGEEIRKTLEPELIAKGYWGCHVYIDVYTGRYVIGREQEEASSKTEKEFGPHHLCWGFDVGMPYCMCIRL